MTTIFLTRTSCSNCGKQSTFERFDRVYAAKTPEIISAILDWDFFKFTCHNCNHKVLIDYPTVVVDEKQLFSIVQMVMLMYFQCKYAL